MNEGRQITKEQAEACMRADSRFWIQPDEFVWQRIENGVWQYLANEGDNAWKVTSGTNSAFTKCVQITIAADPNNTFERLFGSGELTFEEVGAALFRGETVHCDTGKLQYLLRLAGTSGDVFPELHIDWKCMDESGWALACNWSYQRDWKYTLYKEPTNPEPQPEPLTLEALEARVKALEEKK